MKSTLIILLFGWNVCVGQNGWRKIDTVVCVNCITNRQFEGTYNLMIDSIRKDSGRMVVYEHYVDNKTYGYITLIGDTTNNIGLTTWVKGYGIDKKGLPAWISDNELQYFDLKGKQLFVQRFKKGKFLNFYQ